MIALPVGIIANAFNEQIHRRDFVVTWGMVAKVPLFAGLNAGEIADIMRLLRAQQVEPGDSRSCGAAKPAIRCISSRPAKSRSSCRTSTPAWAVGHFFGEIAVLQRTRRSATVVAVTRTSLLVLDAADLHALMERDARIAQRVHETARGRLQREVVSSKGDIVTEEIDERDAPKSDR